MRTRQQLLDQVVEFARGDERVRAVTMEGSLANDPADTDQLSDIDLTFFVRDVREFTRDHTWILAFGELLILQMPDDWHDHPYDYQSRDHFGYLMQFADGNRIDLGLTDIMHITRVGATPESRRVLLNKDGFPELADQRRPHAYDIQAPGSKEFADVCNEFRWVSLYVAKGISRRQVMYARQHYEHVLLPMFLKLVGWKIAGDHAYAIGLGAHAKYLEGFLSAEERIRLRAILPSGDFPAMATALLNLYDWFECLAVEVSGKLGYTHDPSEASKVRDFLILRLGDTLTSPR